MNEDGKDHLPFRSLEGPKGMDDTYNTRRRRRGGLRRRGAAGNQPRMPDGVVELGRVVKPGESVLVPLRWNNPHASEMEVNIWIFEHAEEHPIVVPVRKPSCSGEGHQDNIVSFTVPNLVKWNRSDSGIKGP